MSDLMWILLASPLIGFGARIGWQVGYEVWAKMRTAYWVRTGR